MKHVTELIHTMLKDSRLRSQSATFSSLRNQKRHSNLTNRFPLNYCEGNNLNYTACFVKLLAMITGNFLYNKLLNSFSKASSTAVFGSISQTRTVHWHNRERASYHHKRKVALKKDNAHQTAGVRFHQAPKSERLPKLKFCEATLIVTIYYNSK